MFGKFLANVIFKVAGWKQVGNLPPEIKKCIMVAAPHTSNWDFIYSRGAFYLMDLPVKFTIKSESMVGPLGWLLKRMGALPVNRQKNNNLVNTMVDLFNENEQLIIMVTPEGTRKYQPRWRKGFYHAAYAAGVPIALGYLDYKKKYAGVGPVFYPTGDVEGDIEKIKDFYRTVTAKYPENGIR
jgi:1-acyl-sn-glycerol-3-phosphate acyltransferase